MNYIKRSFAAILAVVLIFGLAACKKETPQTAADDSAAVAQAQTHIAAGNYQEALNVLLAIKEPGAEAKKLLSCFRYLVLEQIRDDGIKTVNTYDNSGNILTGKTTTGENWTENRYTYDKNGNLLSLKRVDSAGDWDNTTYTYNENGHRVSGEYTDSQDGQATIVCNTDGKGNLLSELYTYPDESWDKTTYTYDEKGNLLTMETTTSGETWWKFSYTYDENGNMLTKRYISHNSALDYQINCTYDAAGQLLTMAQTYADGTAKTYTCVSGLYYNPAWGE